MNTQVELTTQSSFNTAYAPLAVLGYCLRKMDYFAPLREQVHIPMRTRAYTPSDKLLDSLVSFWAGCTSLAQINVRLRPDQVLAQAWGRPQFAEQSTISATLDACISQTLTELRGVNTGLLGRYGHTPRHDWEHADLEVDLDLSHLPASATAEGSTKGYGAGKKTARGANWCA
jgi:hypothetical protein